MTVHRTSVTKTTTRVERGKSTHLRVENTVPTYRRIMIGRASIRIEFYRSYFIYLISFILLYVFSFTKINLLNWQLIADHRGRFRGNKATGRGGFRQPGRTTWRKNSY